LYWDSSKCEYATAECKSVSDAIASDKAGERILTRIAGAMNTNFFSADARALFAQRGGITFLKNNTGSRLSHQELRECKFRSSLSYSSYGTHLNILCYADAARGIAYANAKTVTAPFILTSAWFSGAGLLWVDDNGAMRFSLSQRTPFLAEIESGVATSDEAKFPERPVFVSRLGESYFGSSLFRLHITAFDSCMAEPQTYVVMVILGILMRMLEDGFLRAERYKEDARCLLRIAHSVSWWDGARQPFLFQGRKFSVASLHRRLYLRPIEAYKASGVPWSDEEEDGLRKYRFFITALKCARSPRQLAEALAPYADWAAKLHYYILPDMERRGYSFGSPPDAVISGTRTGKETTAWARLKFFDTMYHDTRRERGLYYRLVARDCVERIIADDTRIARAEEYPPSDTRAFGRVERIKLLYQQGCRIFLNTNPEEFSAIRYRAADNCDIWERNPDPLNFDPEAFCRASPRPVA
jgi:Pup amidohydrolase